MKKIVASIALLLLMTSCGVSEQDGYETRTDYEQVVSVQDVIDNTFYYQTTTPSGTLLECKVVSMDQYVGGRAGVVRFSENCFEITESP